MSVPEPPNTTPRVHLRASVMGAGYALCTSHAFRRLPQALRALTPEGWSVHRPAPAPLLFLFLSGAARLSLDLCPRLPGAAPPKNKKWGVGCPRVYTQTTPPGFGPGQFRSGFAPTCSDQHGPQAACKVEGASPALQTLREFHHRSSNYALRT